MKSAVRLAPAVLAARWTGWALVALLAPMRSAADVTRVGPRIEIAAEKTGTFWPSASYHAAADRFLALRVDVSDDHGWQLKGRTLDAGSGAAGPEFYVSPDPSRIHAGDGSAVYNPTTREWLVVYKSGAEGGDDILGRRFGGDGTRLGPPIPLAARPGFQSAPDAAYNAKGRKFLVAWAEKIGGTPQVLSRLFDDDAAPAGPVTRLSEVDDRGKHHPKVAYNPVVNEFLVVWLDYRHWPGEGQDNGWGDTYGQRIDASSGSKIGPNIAVFAGKNVRDGQDSPNSIACGARDGNYAIGITRLMPGGAKVKGWVTLGTVVRPDGAPIAPRIDLSYPKLGSNVSTVYNPADNSFVMSYDNNGHIALVQLSAAGSRLGVAETVVGPSDRGGGMAIRPSDGMILQLSAGNGGLYGQRFLIRP